MGRKNKNDLEQIIDVISHLWTTYDIVHIVVAIIGWGAFLAIIGVIALLVVVLG